MVGLVDIAPLARSVRVRGQDVPVYGVSAHGIAYLISRFPEFRQIDFEKGIDVATLLKLAPDAIAAVIACGTGYPGNADAENVAASLSADSQADFLQVIIEVTMPKGAGPFFVKLQSVMASLDVDGSIGLAPVKAQGTQSQSPSKD